ncbi:hypothetical protein AND_001396 [Anopheles darlingi]|uniref:Uncharacterized protein n=1 Tax=Anopheles darlingi TaxID=43151 RepID=W5JRQ1_ANODA|nr:hypothetical protein AND_001396 [Anopheles darlingi]
MRPEDSGLIGPSRVSLPLVKYDHKSGWIESTTDSPPPPPPPASSPDREVRTAIPGGRCRRIKGVDHTDEISVRHYWHFGVQRAPTPDQYTTTILHFNRHRDQFMLHWNLFTVTPRVMRMTHQDRGFKDRFPPKDEPFAQETSRL